MNKRTKEIIFNLTCSISGVVLSNAILFIPFNWNFFEWDRWLLNLYVIFIVLEFIDARKETAQ